MDARLQRRVQRYGWDKAAAHYEAHWASQLRPSHDCLMALAALQPGERVIELACGTGLVTFAAAAAVAPNGRVFATDLSGDMVESVRGQAAGRGVANVEFARMDAERLDVEDGSYDASLCALGLMYLPDPETALAEMCRVLRPGGRATASVWGQRRHCGWAELLPIVNARVDSEVCPLFFRLGAGDALADAFRDAGFVEVHIERVAAELEYADDEDACAAAFLGGPVALAYSRFDEGTRAAVHAEYLASISGFRRSRGYAVPGEFVIATGRKPG